MLDDIRNVNSFIWIQTYFISRIGLSTRMTLILSKKNKNILVFLISKLQICFIYYLSPIKYLVNQNCWLYRWNGKKKLVELWYRNDHYVFHFSLDLSGTLWVFLYHHFLSGFFIWPCILTWNLLFHRWKSLRLVWKNECAYISLEKKFCFFQMKFEKKYCNHWIISLPLINFKLQALQVQLK